MFSAWNNSTIFIDDNVIHGLKVTHVAIVNVEDMNLCRWLNFLHSGSVPAAAKE